jgi:hypothetical protein
MHVRTWYALAPLFSPHLARAHIHTAARARAQRPIHQRLTAQAGWRGKACPNAPARHGEARLGVLLPRAAAVDAVHLGRRVMVQPQRHLQGRGTSTRAILINRRRPAAEIGSLQLPSGAGDDYGIGHHQNWLRFPYDPPFPPAPRTHAPRPPPRSRRPPSRAVLPPHAAAATRPPSRYARPLAHSPLTPTRPEAHALGLRVRVRACVRACAAPNL